MSIDNLRMQIPTNIAGLDEIFFGGILKGNSILLEGGPGTGKSVLAFEFLYRGAIELKEPGLFISFDPDPSRFQRDAMGFGWDLSELFDKQLLNIRSLTPRSFLEALESNSEELVHEVIGFSAKRVVIDGLAPIRRICGSEPVGRFSEVLRLVTQRLKEVGCTPLFTTEIPGQKLFVESEPVTEQYVCDTVMTLRKQSRRRSVHRTLEVSKSRGQDFMSGEHSLKIESKKGLQVFPRSYARSRFKFDQPSSVVQSSVGNPELDRMLGGGVFDGSITLVVGISGTGKTIAGFQFLEGGIKLGKKGLMVTLDEHPEQTRRNASGLGFDFVALEKTESLVLHYDTPLELDLDEHFYRIQRLVEHHKIRRVVIDSLSAYESAAPEESREFIYALASYFKENLIEAFFNFECPELLGISQISDELKASAIVDNIILLNYVEISTLLRRAITVPKARGVRPDSRTREYIIQSGGLCILEDESVSDVENVPQLPFSSYYGVLARSPTRKSPVIDEHLVAGKELPESHVPAPGAKARGKSVKTKQNRKKRVRSNNLKSR